MSKDLTETKKLKKGIMKASFLFSPTARGELSVSIYLLEIALFLCSGIDAGQLRNPIHPNYLYTKLNVLSCSAGYDMRYIWHKECGLWNLIHETPFRPIIQCESHVYEIFAIADGTRGISINLSRLGIRKITSDAFYCIRNTEELDLSRNYLQLEPGGFKELKKLHCLRLSHNKMRSLVNGTFDGLGSLQTLFLDSNSLQNLPEGLFDGLTRLQHLHVHDNKISSLSAGALSPLTALKRLNLSGNNLGSLANVFSNNRRLTELYLSSNLNLTLVNDSFVGLSSLETLLMNNCGLTSLPIALFQNTRSLVDLRINDNHLEYISVDVLSPLSSLSQLQVARNKISMLRGKPFRFNGNLTIIVMSGNKLAHIRESDFEGLNSMKVLDISSNSLENVSRKSLEGMPMLEALIVNRNYLDDFFSLEKNTRLKYIDVSHNKLTDFKNMGLENLPSLKEFRATDNDIKSLSVPILIPQSAENVEIHLERNNVKRVFSVPTNTTPANFQGKVLVYLAGNPLVCDCHMYDLYRLLKDSSLPYTKFSDGITCQNPPRLQNTDLRNLNANAFICGIEVSCPVNCKCHYRASDRARIVNCTRSGYSHLPLQAPIGTQILYVGHNSLTSLACLKESLWANLTEIHAEGNEIPYEEFPIPRNLKFLGLSDNEIEALPEVIIRHSEASEDFKVTLSNNLWKCDCWILHLRAFLTEYGDKVEDAHSLRCTFANDSVSYSSLISMSEKDLCPAVHRYVFVVGLLLPILCILIFRYRYKLRITEALSTQHHPYLRMLCCVRLEKNRKLFDCFLSYCSEDRDVASAILRELRKKPPQYNFCTHERNWSVGCRVTNNLNFSIQSSRSALIILSEAFASSAWFYLEFQEAFQQMQKDKKFKLILVVLRDIPHQNLLHVDVQYFLSSGMYLRFAEKWFWHKLRDYLRALDIPLKLNVPQNA